MQKACFSLFLLLIGTTVNAQFAPQAPMPGHEGIFLSDGRIVEWASGVTFERGPLDIADESLGYPTYGDSTSPLGYPDGNILSLGDGGQAILTFPHPVKNGPGPDFAIFENGFANPADTAMAYLEFAFVEVSSDGTHFTPFPATCNIQDTLQSDNFTYSDARLVHNLAGKYRVQYGTPFDLEELKDAPGLDVNNITHIRLVDVVGSIDPSYARYDKNGHIINDPYPSVYPSGGFDLDAVGVLNSNNLSLDQFAENIDLSIFPNPATDFMQVTVTGSDRLGFSLADISGRVLVSGSFENSTRIPVSELHPGMYLLYLTNGKGRAAVKVSKQ